jgi:hypothetical protein
MATINRIEDALASEEAPRPKQRRSTFYNTSAVAGVADYHAFEYPRGSALTWRVEPLDFNVGHQIALLQVRLSEIEADAKKMAKREKVEVREAWMAQARFGEWAAQAAEIAGPLLIPTGPARRNGRTTLRDRLVYRRRRKDWKRGINPLAKATDREVAEVVGFLASCLMSSPSRVNRAALN